MASVLAFLAASCAGSADPSGGDALGSGESQSPDAFLAPTATPLSLPEHVVYVIDPNAGERLSSIIVLDGLTARTAKTYEVRFTPSIAFSADGNTMFVADSYQTRMTHGDMNSYVSSFDTRTGALLTDDVPLPDRTLYKFYPIGDPMLFASDDGQALYAQKYGDQSIGDIRIAEIDPDTLEIVREAPYPECAWRIAANSDKWLCVNSSGRADRGFTTTVSTIDPIKGVEITNLAAFQSGRVVDAVKPKNSENVFILVQPATVATVDIQTGAVTQETLEYDESLTLGPLGTMAATPDGARLFVGFVGEDEEHSGFVVSEIRSYDTATWESLGIIELDDPAMHFAVSEDGRRLYSVSPFERSIAIYDTSDLKLRAFRSGVGNTPARVVVPPAMKSAAVSPGR